MQDRGDLDGEKGTKDGGVEASDTRISDSGARDPEDKRVVFSLGWEEVTCFCRASRDAKSSVKILQNIQSFPKYLL